MSPQTKKIIRWLKQRYPDAKCSLNYKTTFQLLVATILSAQCTDKKVNQVLPVLFAKLPHPVDFASVLLSSLKKLIKPIGLYNAKAKNIKRTASIIVDKYKGIVPSTLDELVRLPGVGRKTANVVLGNGFCIPAIVVDTHVGRISNRIGWVNTDNPLQIELALMKIIPRSDWIVFSHLLINHGRKLCTSRSPKCSECGIANLCLMQISYNQRTMGSREAAK